MTELEKLLVANPRYEKCGWLVRPRQTGKQPNYPVVRLANGIEPRHVFLSFDVKYDHKLVTANISINFPFDF